MNAPSKQCRVAILMIDKRLYHEAMANCLFDEINVGDAGLYTVSICSMMPHKESIRHMVSSLLGKNKADVFITIGNTCSMVTKEVLDEQGGKPTIFVGVCDPLEIGLINSLEKPGLFLSGVVRERAEMLPVAQCFAPLYPAVRAVLIPYTEGKPYLFKQAREIQRYFPGIGIHATIVPIERDSVKFFKIINEYIKHIQGLILLEGCFGSGYQEKLAFLCWENCVVLCGSEPYAIDAGVACALAGGVRWIAEEAYKILRQHWEQNMTLGFIPVRILPDNQEFCVNIDMLRRIDLASDAIERICNQPKVRKDRKWTIPFKE